jgi:predicted metal-binding membrane protein
MTPMGKRFVKGLAVWGLAVLSAYVVRVLGSDFLNKQSDTTKATFILVTLGLFFAGLYALLGEEDGK